MGDTENIILQRARSFFKQIRWKKILVFLFFVVLAFAFWLMQIWSQEFEESFNIHVKYVNVPDSIIFEDELPSTFRLKVKDSGSAILEYFFTKRNDTIVVDVRSMIKSASDRALKDTDIKPLIEDKLFRSTDLVSYSPARATYSFSVLHHKRLPVIYDGYVSLAVGYLLDGDLMIEPDSLTAYGSYAALDTLYYAHTVDDTLREVTSARKIQVAMGNVKGVRFSPGSVELSIPVDEFTQKIVEVPIVCHNLPDDLNIKFFPSTVKIPFFVGLKRFNDITADDFKVIVNYDDIKDFRDVSISVRIAESPDYVQTKLPIPADVEFVLEQK